MQVLKSSKIFSYNLLVFFLAVSLGANTIPAHAISTDEELGDGSYDTSNDECTQLTDICEKLSERKQQDCYDRASKKCASLVVGDSDCVDCKKEKESWTVGAARILESATPLVATLGLGYFGYKAQSSSAKYYSEAATANAQACTSRHNAYLDYAANYMSTEILPSQEKSLLNACSSSSTLGYAGFAGLYGDGLGGYSNPWLSAGYSSGFLGGMMGPSYTGYSGYPYSSLGMYSNLGGYPYGMGAGVGLSSGYPYGYGNGLGLNGGLSVNGSLGGLLGSLLGGSGLGLSVGLSPYGTGYGYNPYGNMYGYNPYGTGSMYNPYGTGSMYNPYGTGTGSLYNPYGTGIGINGSIGLGGYNPYSTGLLGYPYGSGSLGYNPYGMNGSYNPYATGVLGYPYNTTGSYNPYLSGSIGTGYNPYTGTYNPYTGTGTYNPYTGSGTYNPYTGTYTGTYTGGLPYYTGTSIPYAGTGTYANPYGNYNTGAAGYGLYPYGNGTGSYYGNTGGLANNPYYGNSYYGGAAAQSYATNARAYQEQQGTQASYAALQRNYSNAYNSMYYGNSGMNLYGGYGASGYGYGGVYGGLGYGSSMYGTTPYSLGSLGAQFSIGIGY